ncbi:MAG: TetR/AcrR family transcriptional regulator [Marinobacter sp.]|uniref:TetR/AcrR family transcriptional regulator n=1 Tax=unclassified Marinobacter TaxID=83889 RepID=UPI00273CD7BC|nr:MULTISPECIES: TetR/AcrR family transcriptional regulator [unclassified Marinobacter]MDP4547597.1 TetR/AcrR family transcriptional regulator [Marinobacter sp. MDS2]
MAYRETDKMRQRKAEARENILKCTSQCVAEKGFRSARITTIANLAGVATGTIYRHFESREDLFAEIFRLATQREVDKVAEALAVEGDAVHRLNNALCQFARRALKGPTRAWAMIAEPVDPKVEEERLLYRKAYASLFEQTIQEGIAEGSIPEQDARITSTCLVGAISESLVGPLSPAQTASLPTTKTDQEALINTIVRYCVRGLTGTRS